MNSNPIIILGGMGPQASLELHRLLLKKSVVPGIMPDQYPEILHASLSVKDLIDSEVDTLSAMTTIRRACRLLPLQDASAIGLACNTAHLLISRLDELQTENFVSMIDTVCSKIKEGNFRKIGLLASPRTIKSGLYTTPLTQDGVEVLAPSESNQDKTAIIIRNVLSGSAPHMLRNDLSKIAEDLVDRGADCIVLGCTELPLVGIDVTVPVINSLDCLADTLLTRHNQENEV